MRVASFFPFQTCYCLNGHSFIEQELKRAQIGFRKTDNAFLAVDDVALQAAADKLSPDIIGNRLDYWTLIREPTNETIFRSAASGFCRCGYSLCGQAPGALTSVNGSGLASGAVSVSQRNRKG
jgi:hypothetical protein